MDSARVLIAVLFASVCLGGAAEPDKKSGAAPAVSAEPAPALAAKRPVRKAPAAGEEKRVEHIVRSRAADREQAEEEGSVMIDQLSAGDSGGRVPPEEEAAADDDGSAAGGLPSSYGQVKGTLTDGARNLLVLESDDGVISFVQVLVGKNSAAWKLVARLPRGAD